MSKTQLSVIPLVLVTGSHRAFIDIRPLLIDIAPEAKKVDGVQNDLQELLYKKELETKNRGISLIAVLDEPFLSLATSKIQLAAFVAAKELGLKSADVIVNSANASHRALMIQENTQLGRYATIYIDNVDADLESSFVNLWAISFEYKTDPLVIDTSNVNGMERNALIEAWKIKSNLAYVTGGMEENSKNANKAKLSL